MQTLYQILGLMAAGLIIWYLYRTIKGRPDLFTGKNINSSLKTMGILAILLIVFIAFLVLMLRASS